MIDSIAQRVTPGSLEAWEWRNSVNNCSNGASEESVGIYAKSRCQWTSRSIDLELGPRSYDRLKPQGP